MLDQEAECEDKTLTDPEWYVDDDGIMVEEEPSDLGEYSRPNTVNLYAPEPLCCLRSSLARSSLASARRV